MQYKSRGCTGSQEVRHELNVPTYAINEKVVEYREKWKQHVTRTRKERKYSTTIQEEEETSEDQQNGRCKIL